MIKCVLDTNVLVSGACLPRSIPGRILNLWLAGRIRLIVSEHILAEFADVMGRKKIRDRFQLTPEDLAAFIAKLRSRAIVVPTLSPAPERSRDPDDDAIIECALVAQVSHIVSGDKHMLELKQLGDLSIVTPAAFLRQLQGPGRL